MWKENIERHTFRKSHKELPWSQRNPRTLVFLVTSAAMLIFYSKPIYDIYFNDNLLPVESMPKSKKSI